MNKGGIYRIINLLTLRFYIGSTFNLEGREISHFSLLERNEHPNTYLQNSFNEHGIGNFKFEILEYVFRFEYSSAAW